MAIDLEIINWIHGYLSDRTIFDIEFVWLILNIFTASAPISVTEKLPKCLMRLLNAITFHWKNSKDSDISGRKKY